MSKERDSGRKDLYKESVIVTRKDQDKEYIIEVTPVKTAVFVQAAVQDYVEIMQNRAAERKRSRRSSSEANTPRGAEYLLYLFLSKSQREHMLGDLEEDYGEVLTKFGSRRAWFWYWWQAVRTVMRCTAARGLTYGLAAVKGAEVLARKLGL